MTGPNNVDEKRSRLKIEEEGKMKRERLAGDGWI
jgi:hypothetical protein